MNSESWVRGKSQRALHYKGFLNNKRVYEKHSLGISSLGVMMVKMGVSVWNK